MILDLSPQLNLVMELNDSLGLPDLVPRSLKCLLNSSNWDAITRSGASESEDTPVLDELDGGCIEALAAQSLGKIITFPLTHTMPL
jgi:hypothetical protein